MLLLVLLLLLLLYLGAIMPRTFHRKDFSVFKNPYFAHRGLHGGSGTDKVPENSLPAFLRAVEQGYGIELDVQLSKDRIPVVFHDFTLKRVCGIAQKVCELTCEELKSLRLAHSNESIPTLEEVLNTVKGRVPLLIEFKVEFTDTSVCDITSPMLNIKAITASNPLIPLYCSGTGVSSLLS